MASERLTDKYRRLRKELDDAYSKSNWADEADVIDRITNEMADLERALASHHDLPEHGRQCEFADMN
jgi:hypothetical protein